MLVRVIGRANDSHQLPMIEPVQATGLAIIDDHVAGTIVEVRIHPLAAVRTIDFALQVMRIRSRGNQGSLLSGAKFID